MLMKFPLVMFFTAWSSSVAGQYDKTLQMCALSFDAYLFIVVLFLKCDEFSLSAIDVS